MGSCCTLIANRLQSAPSIPSLSECSLLLEGTILLDTLNLSTVSNKTTKEDFAAVEWLEQHREESRHPAVSLRLVVQREVRRVLLERLVDAGDSRV